MRFQTGVTSATWDERACRWVVKTDRGDVVTCRFLLFCNGTLTDPKFSPNIGPGRPGAVKWPQRFP